MDNSKNEYGSKWGYMPSSVHLQLPFFFKSEKYSLLRKVLLVVVALFYAKAFEAAIYDQKTMEFVFGTIVALALWVFAVQLLKVSDNVSRRQKITYNKFKRKQRLDYREKQMAFDKAKLLKEEKDRKQEELDAVNRRLEEAMKPVNWDEYKPSIKPTLKKVNVSKAKSLPKKRATPKKLKRPKTFKAVDIGDI